MTVSSLITLALKYKSEQPWSPYQRGLGRLWAFLQALWAPLWKPTTPGLVSRSWEGARGLPGKCERLQASTRAGLVKASAPAPCAPGPGLQPSAQFLLCCRRGPWVRSCWRGKVASLAGCLCCPTDLSRRLASPASGWGERGPCPPWESAKWSGGAAAGTGRAWG